MKYRDIIESSFISGSQPHKSVDRKGSNKGKKIHSFKKEDGLVNDFVRHRASYKRAETKNMMRDQLRDIQMAF